MCAPGRPRIDPPGWIDFFFLNLFDFVLGTCSILEEELGGIPESGEVIIR